MSKKEIHKYSYIDKSEKRTFKDMVGMREEEKEREAWKLLGILVGIIVAAIAWEFLSAAVLMWIWNVIFTGHQIGYWTAFGIVFLIGLLIPNKRYGKTLEELEDRVDELKED